MALVQLALPCGIGTMQDRSLVERIVVYLKQHPRALDTPEGIQTWWLDNSRAVTVERVQAALDYLVSKTVMCRMSLADGQAVYGASWLNYAMANRVIAEFDWEGHMPDMSWSLTVQVSGGASVTTSADAVPVEAVDRVEVSIDAGATDKVIELQPSAANQVALLHIRASAYSDKITFKISDGAGDTSAIKLTEPQLYTSGAMPLFARAPKSLKVSNATPDAVKVEVVVARDATP